MLAVAKVYEWKCSECDLVDVNESSDTPPSNVHLVNGKYCEGTFKRVYSLGGISFKGNGFYKTDSKR